MFKERCDSIFCQDIILMYIPLSLGQYKEQTCCSMGSDYFISASLLKTNCKSSHVYLILSQDNILMLVTPRPR